MVLRRAASARKSTGGKEKGMRKAKGYLLAGVLLLVSAVPGVAQRDHGFDRHQQYYGGVDRGIRGGGYDQHYRDHERWHHHDQGGGIGPGYGALIGAGGGAALGAVFGGGLKGALIGGAAGAGIGAIGGALAQGSDSHYHH
jgi:hypothetical protein